MPDPTRLYVLFGGFVLLGVLMLALRWAFGNGRNLPAPRIPDPDDPTGDGLLAAVAHLPTEAAAGVLRDRLARADIRATIGRTERDYRLLVFADDLVSARLVLRE